MLVTGTFNNNIAGSVQPSIGSLLSYGLNGYTLPLVDFANKPGATLYGVDAVVNNGVATDFRAVMTTSVDLRPVSSLFPLNASVEINYTSRLTRITATLGGQPITDFTLTGDSGIRYGTVVAVRDFEGNGRSGALLYDPVNGQEYTALSNGDGTYLYISNLFSPGFDILRTGDFNFDGKADLVVYNSHNGLAYIGMGNGDGTFAFKSLFWSFGYNFVEAGDLNGDGKTDFVLYKAPRERSTPASATGTARSITNTR